MKQPIVGIALVAVALASGTPVSAQALGTFGWQLQPYCNVITVNVAGQPSGVFTLDGFDDQCGAGQRASVVGTAFLNPDGTVGIGLNTVLSPGGAFVHVEARISLASLNGPWRDSAGNSGTFAFTPGAGSGGAVRPVPSNGVAAASISAGHLAPGAVAAHISPAQVQTRVAGTCGAGHYLRGINQDGSVLCEPVPTTIGASARWVGRQDSPPTATATVISFSANGTGPLVVPFRARLLVHGLVRIDKWYYARSNHTECTLYPASGQAIGMTAFADVAPSTGVSLPLLGFVDVEPGTYDVQMRCFSLDGWWSSAELTAVAVPR